ncbi:endo-1,4-beta-xylanase [Saccharicrinis fermentans]|uniref:Beta-xylanase n=1 Tax=Saccharicrinis fermentans DSM 9555 = JCM 21142 TaxID=869213 RepID=W7XZD0_9BACT|nr:endo-1,4-beta-xylanase [Saccharicrinis fermentans]GAF04035.1 endo-1,4-beta-xylanase A precursor [Saccharicrinis fermentans DSM 9555 = JCM 21142]
MKWSPIADQNFETDEAPNYEGSSDAIVSLTTDGEGANGEGRAIKVTNTVVQSDDWKTQFFVVFDEPMELGETYRLTMDVKADMEVSCSTQAHITPGNYKHWSFFGSISATTSWTTFTKEIVISEDNEGAGALAINLGLYAGSYYFDNITIAKYNPNAGPSWNIVSGADFETEDASNYQIDLTSSISFSNDGEGAEGKGRALIVRNPTVRDNDWESQFFLSFSPATEVGEKYILSMDVKADEDVSYSTQAHITPGNYKYWNFFGSINATTEWSNFTKEITISDEVSGVGAIAFNLGNMATNYYFDNIQLTKLSEGSSVEQIIEKTPEEKRDTVSYALEKWISEMMLATKKYVKAWDVVNEPMDDGNPYELKSGIGKEVDSDHFYWQDYLGKDYAVMAFNLARQYGNTDDVLFINDYNLAYNIDKCKGLIAYVDYIEQQGVFIDGIGTQMHINVNSDRDKIIQMFELLAETGKLIKVSELDVGLGDHKQTSLATEADYMSQADMYQFVVEKYFELIPANQRYGITVWSPIDSPAESSWRAGEPIGLWTEGYSRKHAYAGFADGLSESN